MNDLVEAAKEIGLMFYPFFPAFLALVLGLYDWVAPGASQARESFTVTIEFVLIGISIVLGVLRWRKKI